MYYDLTELYHVASPLNASRLTPDYSQTCYDAAWTLAHGLDTVVKRMTCGVCSISKHNAKTLHVRAFKVKVKL